MAGVYVHLPFCPYVCPYCDFAKWPFRASAAERYLAALGAELDAAPAFRADTLFLGGGTPNAHGTAAVTALVARVRGRFALPDDAEITIELNPDPPLCRDFGAYVAAGIDRFSFGVQSFDADELRVLGRRHAAADIAAAVASARAAGARSVSLDLIFGTPGQTLASWQATLDAALALAPDHVSTYGLTVEAGTPYAAWQARDPGAFASQDLEADLYALAIERLETAGFEHYEISNFARPGFRSRHNANYWASGDYLGFGVGAASYRDGVRSVHTRDREAYEAAALAGHPIPGDQEKLEGAARAGEAVMLALRTEAGVEVAPFAERYGIDFLAHYGKVLTELRAAGVIEIDGAHVRLTRKGRFVANDVCGAFLGPAA